MRHENRKIQQLNKEIFCTRKDEDMMNELQNSLDMEIYNKKYNPLVFAECNTQQWEVGTAIWYLGP